MSTALLVSERPKPHGAEPVTDCDRFARAPRPALSAIRLPLRRDQHLRVIDVERLLGVHLSRPPAAAVLKYRYEHSPA